MTLGLRSAVTVTLFQANLGGLGSSEALAAGARSGLGTLPKRMDRYDAEILARSGVLHWEHQGNDRSFLLFEKRELLKRVVVGQWEGEIPKKSCWPSGELGGASWNEAQTLFEDVVCRGGRGCKSPHRWWTWPITGRAPRRSRLVSWTASEKRKVLPRVD